MTIDIDRIKHALEMARDFHDKDGKMYAALSDAIEGLRDPAQAALTREQIFHICFEHASQNLTEDAVERQSERIADAIVSALAAQPPAAPVEMIETGPVTVNEWEDDCRQRSSADSGDSKLPLQYEDGPDYCIVRDAQGRDFALTMQPDLMKAMEKALSNGPASFMRQECCDLAAKEPCQDCPQPSATHLWRDAAIFPVPLTAPKDVVLERDEARQIVAEANNSLYGSHGYFHSLNGGAFDKYHLSRGIEDLKARINGLAPVPAMRAALESAQRIIERDYPNGQLAIDIRNALAVGSVDPAQGALKEAEIADAPLWYSAEEASAWTSGYNSAISVITARPPAAPVEIPGFTIDALHKQALEMPPADQHKLAEMIAANVGYELTPEPPHPDCPHNGSSAAGAPASLALALSSERELRVKNLHIDSLVDYLAGFDDATEAALAHVPQEVPNPRPAAFLAWAREMFGPVAKVRGERLMRFVEEAIELAHADGMSAGTLEHIVNRVYTRPAGDVLKEIGQAQACLETYAENIGESASALAEIEWQRVQNIPREEWQRRHSAKQAIGIALTEGAKVSRPQRGVGE